MKDLKISIPKPCHENWDEMTPADQGRHCDKCKTTVVDFSQMSDEAILNFFKVKMEKKICGHFKSSQLEETLSGWQKWLLSLYERMENKLSFNLLKTGTLVCLTMVMVLTGCHKKIHKIGTIRSNNPPKVNEFMLKGDVSVEPEDKK
jgi:hypothetical protein